jgi:hypothetical protein
MEKMPEIIACEAMTVAAMESKRNECTASASRKDHKTALAEVIYRQ